MKSALLAAALTCSAAAASANDAPCRTPVGGKPESVPAVSRASFSELDVQARCLKWEYNLPQKAEFIPPTTQPPRQERALRIPPPPSRPDPAISYADFLSGGTPLGMGKSWLTLPEEPRARR